VLNTQDDGSTPSVIDEFRKQSAPVLDALIFHDAVNGWAAARRSPTATTAPSRQRRCVPSDQQRVHARGGDQGPYTVDLKPLGGSFQIDRVLADIARGAEVTFQMQQLVKATTSEVHRRAHQRRHRRRRQRLRRPRQGAPRLDDRDQRRHRHRLDGPRHLRVPEGARPHRHVPRLLDGAPTLLIGNRQLIAKIWAIARRANSNVERPTDGLLGANGRRSRAAFYGETSMLVDAGDKPGTTNPIIPVESRDPDNTVYTVTETGSPAGGTFTLTVTTPAARRRPPRSPTTPRPPPSRRRSRRSRTSRPAASPSPAPPAARTRSPSSATSPTRSSPSRSARTASPAARRRR
jgi:hypothetical protein